jgi:hypothetical protein
MNALSRLAPSRGRGGNHLRTGQLLEAAPQIPKTRVMCEIAMG